MRSIFLIGANFVRTQWIALAVMCVYVLGIGGVYRVHTQRDELLFFLRWHAGYAIFFATMIAALFCLLVGGTAAWLGQQGRIPTDGLTAIMVLLFCCCVFAVSVGLF